MGVQAVNVARLTVNVGLPGARIQAVFTGYEGVLWIGTNDDLVRWAAGLILTEVTPANA